MDPAFPTETPRLRHPLAGAWQMLPVEEFAAAYPEDGWLAVEVPHHWQMVPGLETYAGKAVYRLCFPAAAVPGYRYYLRLNGVFYEATAYLNGHRLGRNEGYFFPVEYDVTAVLATDNELLVEVACPNEDEKINKRLITGVFSHWDAMDPTLNPGGIWLPVELVARYPTHVAETFFHTVDFNEQFAEVRVRSFFEADTVREVEWHIRFVPDNFEGPSHEFQRPLRLAPGRQDVVAELQLPGYRLWWTHDRGFPHLYRLEQELRGRSGRLLDRTWIRVGIRLFEIKEYLSRLNRERLFIKGNNYAPTDARLSTTTPERVHHDLDLARAAHMNMLRVHAHVAHPSLYAAADEQGMLLWQDFPLQWHYRNEIEGEAIRQVQEMVKLLYNHASVVKWCVHNEPFSVVSIDDTSLRRNAEMLYTVFLFSRNDAILDRRLRAAARRVDPTRFASANSGMFGWLWRGTDTHFYFGWYPVYGPMEGFEWVCEFIPRSLRFVSEFGAQSFPNYESAVRFMSADLATLDWQALVRRHGLQLTLLRHWLPIDEYPDLQTMIQATQDYQSEINRYHIDRLRLRKYNPTGGILPFMFHDPNPAVLWSVLDYWRVPKSSYYAMQKAFHPLYVFALIHRPVYGVGEAMNIPIYLVNDSPRAHPSVAITAVLEEESGHILQRKYLATSIEADSLARQVEQISFRATVPGRYVLRLYLALGTGDTGPDPNQPVLTNDYRFVIAEKVPAASKPTGMAWFLNQLSGWWGSVFRSAQGGGGDLAELPPDQPGGHPQRPE